MTMIEVDLLDADGVITSVAQADPGNWNLIANQATQYAAQHGFTITTMDQFNAPERTLAVMGDVQNWISAHAETGGVTKRPANLPPTTPSELPTTTLGIPNAYVPAAGAGVGGLIGGLFFGLPGMLIGGIAGWIGGTKQINT